MKKPALPDRLTYSALPGLKMTKRALNNLLERGEYVRVAPGVFLRAGLTDDRMAGWISAATKKPAATLCLSSALAFHGLLDEAPSHSHIAVPLGTMPPMMYSGDIQWHRFRPGSYEVGRSTIRLPGDVNIGIYSAERTILDIFAMKNEWGIDLAIESLHRWLKRPYSDPSVLFAIVPHFPRARPSLKRALTLLGVPY